MNKKYEQISSASISGYLSKQLSNGSTRFALWFYPETSKNKRKRLIMRLAQFDLGRHDVEPVTLYGTDQPYQPVESKPHVFLLSEKSIASISKHFKSIERLCDSIATYSYENREYALAIVFHERMILHR